MTAVLADGRATYDGRASKEENFSERTGLAHRAVQRPAGPREATDPERRRPLPGRAPPPPAAATASGTRPRCPTAATSSAPSRSSAADRPTGVWDRQLLDALACQLFVRLLGGMTSQASTTSSPTGRIERFVEADAVGDALNAEAVHRLRPGADHDRGDGDDDPIDEPRRRAAR